MKGNTESASYAMNYFRVAGGLYFWWLACFARWLKHLATLIRVQIPVAPRS
jgi:uncharacterized membrane protein